MSVDFQIVSIPFAQGIDTKRDSRQLDVGKLVKLENGTLKGINRISKRSGFDKIADEIDVNELHPLGDAVVGVMRTSLSASFDNDGNFLGTDQGGLTLIGDQFSGGYRTISNTPVVRCELKDVVAASGRFWQIVTDRRDDTIYRVVLQGLRAQVFVGEDQAIRVADFEISTSSTYRMVGAFNSSISSSSDLIVGIVYAEGSNLFLRSLNVTTSTLGSAVALATDLKGSTIAESVTCLSAQKENFDYRVVAYVDTSDKARAVLISGKAKIRDIDPLSTDNAVDAPLAVGCLYYGVRAHIAYVYRSGGNAYVSVANSLVSSSTLATQPADRVINALNTQTIIADFDDIVQIGAVRSNKYDGIPLRDVTYYVAIPQNAKIYKVSVDTDGTAITLNRFVDAPNASSSLQNASRAYAFLLAGVPFEKDRRVYVPLLERVVVSSPTELRESRRLLLVEDTEATDVAFSTTLARPVADPIPQYRPRNFDALQYDAQPRPLTLCYSDQNLEDELSFVGVEEFSGDEVRWPIAYFKTLGPSGEGGPLQISEAVLSFGRTNGSVTVDDSLLILGDGVTTAVDGQGARPNTPRTRIIDIVRSSTPTDTEDYGVQVFYAYIDASGRVHRGPVESFFASSGLNTDLRAIGFYSYLFPSNESNGEIYRVDLYRTEDNGSVHYFIASSVSENASDNGAKFFQTSSGVGLDSSGNLPVDAPDKQISQNASIYTTAQLEAAPNPPADQTLFAFGNRVHVVANGSTIYSSKPILPSVAPEFSPVLTSESSSPSSIKFGVEMDGVAYLFAEKAIYRLVGQGLNAAGAGSGYQLLRLNTTVGAKNRNMYALTPLGIAFVSERGVELLGRDLQVQYLGAEIEQLINASTPIGMTSSGELNELRIYLLDGTVCVYDWLVNQWSTWKITPNTPDTANLIRAVTRSGGSDYVALNLENSADSKVEVLKENPSIYQESSRNYAMRVRTGWISPASPQGYFRCRRFSLLAENIGSHTLTVLVRYDYDDTVAQTETFDPSTGILTGDDNYQFRRRLDRQKCSAIQFEIVTSATSNAALVLSNLSLEVAALSGMSRLRAEQSG